MTLTIHPTQKPRPPILMAAHNRDAVLRAARMSGGWYINPHARLETIKEQLNQFRVEREERGLKQRTPMTCRRRSTSSAHQPGSRAIQLAEEWVGIKWASLAEMGTDKALPGNELFRRPVQELIENRISIGTPDECINEFLTWWRELGVTHFTLHTKFPGMPFDESLASQTLIGKEVVSVVREEVGLHQRAASQEAVDNTSI